MFRIDQLRASVIERLTAAAEEIFSIFEKTIKDYEEVVFRSKREIEQQRRLTGWKAPLQLSVPEEDVPSEQDHCERKTDLREDDQEPPHIEEEREEELWAAQTGEKQEEADTKHSLFNIIYVQRSDEDRFPRPKQEVESKEGCLSEQSEPDKDGCGASETTSDAQMSDAPLQLSVPEEDVPSEQDHCERKTDLREDDQEPPHIKEEQEEADTEHSLFNIIYVQRSDEDRFPRPKQEVESKEGCLSEQSEPDKDGCGASETTSDAQMSDGSDDEWRDGRGFHSAVSRKKPQRAGEAADRPYTCSVCNRNFRIKSVLTRHMKTHTGERPYSCSVCGKRFIQRSSLQTHMNTHSGQKPYTCSFCGRQFSQVGNMNTHIRIHTGEKPHSCTNCGKRFREKADLIKHTIIHTGEKPYVCTVCHVKFSAQSNLTRHMKTHSGEKPYSCTACEKRFNRCSHLIIHMKTHAEESL